MDYPRAFRLIRGAKDLTKRELAEFLGVHESYISMIESGKRAPGRRLIEGLSDRFGVPIHLFDLLAAEAGDIEHIGPESAQAVGKLLLGLLPDA